MNNEQFRKLVLESQSSSAKTGSSGTPNGLLQRRQNDTDSSGFGGAGRPALASALGSRMRSSIPMTPRSVKGVDFARQLAEHRRESQQPPTKKFKSSAAPKGTKLASGYQDLASLRRQLEQHEGDDGNNIEKRVKALEEMVKLGQIDQATFEKLRKEIGVGGDVNSTHLVKGLDWDLLRRVKAGEAVTKPAEKKSPGDEEPAAAAVEDVDEELDRMLEKEVQPAAPKEKVKKGNMAPPPPPPAAEPGKKMSRDEILRQLKASRAAAAGATASTSAQPSEPSLGSKFKKIGDNKGEKKRWIEQDASGRRKEVLITTGPDGKVKRKVRWLDKPGPETDSNGLLIPDKNAKPLGMEIPAHIASKAAEAPEPEDDDIFEGVGTDYNPLGDIAEDDSESESEKEEDKRVEAAEAAAAERSLRVDTDKEKAAPQPSRPRNYFSTSAAPDTTAEPVDRSNPLTNDPTILAALKRAAALRQASPSAEAKDEEDVDPDILARRKKFLEEARRREEQDALDIDYGFGSSRIEDEEDEEGITYEGRGKRKRGPKKRKGDKNSAADVLRVLEARRKEG
ncbi:hypothetical protein VTN77DRAFT_4658 [Rasamsonia byssochlamydoides]|uniref:uncharacterized protein n=1 Tax=Rasamsonia byssochlamydoides TaxID=89139 RepID=UPI0037438524